MSQAMRDLASRIAYLERSIELLRDRLRDVDSLGSLSTGGQALDHLADSLVADANGQADRVADHIELAIQYAEAWYAAVHEVVGNQAR